MKIIGLLLFLFVSTACTMAGFAIGEGFDVRGETTTAVPRDSVLAQLQEGRDVKILTVTSEELHGEVIRLEADAVVLNQREGFPWPNGGRVVRTLPLASIHKVQLVERTIRWRVVGTVTGVVIDAGLVLFFYIVSGIAGAAGT